MLFLVISVTIITSMYSYVGIRLIPSRHKKPDLNRTLWLALVVLILIVPAPIILRQYGVEAIWSDLIAWIGYITLGFFTLLFSFLIIRDIALITNKIFRFISGLLSRKTTKPTIHDSERRRFLGSSLNLGIVAVSGSISAYGLFSARHTPEVVEITVPIKNLHKDLEGFRIVQITDTHAGPTIKRPYIQAIVDKTNSLDPDLIAFTGDLADGSVHYLKDDVAPLAELSSRYGNFFVTGNHEYYSGVGEWLKEIQRLGFTILINEHRYIKHREGKIVIAGVTDYRAGNYTPVHTSSPASALAGSRDDIPRILLAHRPDSIFNASKAGVDLQISGHTHGGQFPPWNFITSMAVPYLSGLYRHDNTWIYVSRGTGYWGPPLRLGEPSEITVIKLV